MKLGAIECLEGAWLCLPGILSRKDIHLFYEHLKVTADQLQPCQGMAFPSAGLKGPPQKGPVIVSSDGPGDGPTQAARLPAALKT
jgi:hypothetical protein